ncbi:hypothetical protein [Streptosporangium sandarakinum]
MDADSRPRWQRLGRLLAERRARIDPRYATRKVFASEVNIGPAVLRDIEIAARDNYSAPTIAAIEAAYRWEPGSIRLVLDGGDPVEQSPDRGFESRSEWPAVGVRSSSTAALTQTATMRRTPRWFAKEVERRSWDLEHLTIHQLRALAEHFGYSLAELLLHADLASDADLEIDERPAPPSEGESEALAEFDAAMKRATSSPFLSPRQRKEFEELAGRIREDAIRKIRGDT